jgi:hypothetical protein
MSVSCEYPPQTPQIAFSTRRLRDEPVPEAEGHLQPVGGRVGEVVVDEEVVVAARRSWSKPAGARRLAEGLLAAEAEEPVTAVRESPSSRRSEIVRSTART